MVHGAEKKRFFFLLFQIFDRIYVKAVAKQILWGDDTENLSTLMAICEEKSSITSGFPS